MKILTLSAITALSLTLFSCKKDASTDQNTTGELTGTWNLQDAKADGHTEIGMSAPDMGSVKATIDFNYVTLNNKGSITFTADQIQSTHVSYDIDGMMKMKQFMDGTLIYSKDSIWKSPWPEANSLVDYVRVSEDSIYCPNGTFANFQPEGDADFDFDQYTNIPCGIKYRFENGKLIMRMTADQEISETDEGVTQSQVVKMVADFTLTK